MTENSNINCILKVDNRECLKEKLSKCDDIIIKLENLPLGDFIIEVNNQILVLIERKTLQDLTASIKDGRLHSQKKHLIDSVDRQTIYYLIEGNFDYNEDIETSVSINGISKKAIISSVLNTLVRDNIKVIFTKNIQDTFDFIYGLYKRIKLDSEKYINHETKNEIDIVKLKSSKSITKEICFINQLCQVPDISKKTAKAISIFFENSLKVFYERLINKNDEEKLKVLKTIYIEDDSGGKRRKISEKVIKNIITFMF